MRLDGHSRRYRPSSIGVFHLTHGEVLTKELKVFRHPSAWKPSFSPWRELTGRFRRLQKVLESSPGIQVKKGKTIDRFTESGYDGVEDEVTVRAKAALLNLYGRLTSMPHPPGSITDWFSGVRRILSISHERFVAVVEPEMAKVVRRIKDEITKHELYKHTPAENHFPNFPGKFQPLKSKMYSIKTRESRGNVQITIAPGTDPDSGREVFLADIDIDENGELFRHLVDVFFIHRFTGGTDPLDIHEYLLAAFPGVDLGDSLVVKKRTPSSSSRRDLRGRRSSRRVLSRPAA